MSRIHGVSAFGLMDCAAVTEGGCKRCGFYLADAVLPQSSLGQIRTGDEAESERIHSGLQWPPEARVVPGKPLRRVPIPVAWSLLVDAGDRTVRWEGARGNSTPLASILATHVKGLLDKNDFTYSNQDHAVVAIPDHLDEYGQEALLQAFGSNRSQVSLLWRPVAAAMTWLDASKPTNLEQDDFILVIYLGPDGMDFTTFGLREKKHKGQKYVLPVRNRPSRAPLPPGWEWACALSAEIAPLCREDYGAFWQTFTTFPEVWAAIAGAPWDTEDLPRPWSTSQGWRLWDPAPILSEKALDCGQGQSAIMRKLLKGSCKLPPTDRKGSGETWGEHLKAELNSTLASQPGRLRGAVLCGPLAPRKMPRWLNPDALDLLPDTEPRPDTLWMASACEDPVATGARIYGERLNLNLPTYLDTLPQIATLAIESGRFKWIDLVEATTCEGGNPYKNKICGKFKLNKGCDWIEVFLRKETRDGLISKDNIPTFGLHENFLEPARKRIQSFDSIEEFESFKGWDRDERLKKFADLYAKAHFSPRAPYRKGNMQFPATPKHDTIIDLNVEMRPASGLAQVELVPHQKDFLKGRRVFFDYSRMKDEFNLPLLKRGWPETVKMKLTVDQDALAGDTNLAIHRFLKSSISDMDYQIILDEAKKQWTQNVQDFQDGNWVYLKKIDQDGRSGSSRGQAIVEQLRKKVEEHFDSLTTGSVISQKMEKLIIRGSWLWGGTPENISLYLEDYLALKDIHQPQQWNYFIESASRCFTSQSQFQCLFSAIYRRLKRPPRTGLPFPNESARSIYRILIYRDNAQSALSEDQAHAFLYQSLRLIEQELTAHNIKQKFFQAVTLFFGLLRYRKKNPKFVDPDENRYAGIFEELKTCLEKAKDIVRVSRPNAADRLTELLDSIMAYMRYDGAPGIIEILLKEADK